MLMLGEVLDKLYDSEINHAIVAEWDKGFLVRLGDEMSGWFAEMYVSQRKRKRIEECFGWLKTVALLRKLRHRGIFKVGWVFTFAATVYNLGTYAETAGLAS